MITRLFFGLLTFSCFCSVFCEEGSKVRTAWDLDGPCQIYIQQLASAQAQMTECATRFAAPPKVCTNCIDQYIQFKQAEYLTHHLTNVTSLDNRTCTEIFYASYALSYAADISRTITKQLWESSRCQSCLIINWQFEHQNSTIEYDKKTITFEKSLMAWRACVTNYTDPNGQSNSTICDACGKEFDELFEYYWKIYKDPGVDFCLDVETTMNDTMNLWHEVWKCPDEKRDTKHYDLTIVAFSATFLAIIICLFYSGSYIQIEHAQRNLIRYSRIQPPQGQRSRLLSSSTVDNYSYTPGSSMYGGG